MKTETSIVPNTESLEQMTKKYITKINHETNYADIHLEYAINEGANWQKEQSRSMEESFYEMFDALERLIMSGDIEMVSCTSKYAIQSAIEKAKQITL